MKWEDWYQQVNEKSDWVNGLSRKIMTEFARFRLKKFSYLVDNGNGDKKAEGIKKVIIKWRLCL